MKIRTNLSDQEIIDDIKSDCKQVNDEAIKYLYITYYPFIRSFVNKNRGDDEDAADIFQEAMVILYNKIKEGIFRGDASLKTFLYAVSRNLWLKELRKHPYQFSDIVDIDNYINLEVNQPDNVDLEEKEGLLSKSIKQLGAGCREILTHYYYSKYPMKIIAEKLGLSSEHAAKNKKYRCMQQLIKLCKQNGLTKS